MKVKMMRVKCIAFLVLASSFCFADERPNVLFIFADDWGRHAGVYRGAEGTAQVNDVVQTPVIDSIATEGVLFQNAYVSAPSCTPCRSSLFSGQHFWRTGWGSILLGAKWDASIPTFPLLLEEHGYAIGASYKVWGPGTPLNAPYGGMRCLFNRAGFKFNKFSQGVTDLVEKGVALDDAKERMNQEVRRNFRDFLATREDGKPFCYFFGPTNPHRKWTQGSGEALWGMDPEKLKGKMPAFLPDVPVVREDLNDYLGEVQAFDMGVGTLLDDLKKTGEYENTLIIISGDHGAPGFPYGKCNLYDFGSGVPLIIAGVGVNGGRVVDDFTSLTDLAPTLLEAGNVPVPDVMTGRSLWNVLTSDNDGLVDPTRTQVFIGRERHVSSARPNELPYPQRAIRVKDYLLIINFKPDRFPMGNPYKLGTDEEPSFDEIAEQTATTLYDEDQGPTKAWIVQNRNNPEWKSFYEDSYGKRPEFELYDMRKDSDQVNNLADNPEYKEVFEKLKKQLITELETTGDERVLNDGTFWEGLGQAKK